MDPKLLDKYWNAETSLEEETRLMNEMAGSSADEAAYFAMIAQARQQKSKLTLSQIQMHADAEPVPTAKVRPMYRMVASIAATLLFAITSIGVWNYTQKMTQPVHMAETYDDPQKAYEEMREALAFVSMKLNKSQRQAMTNIQKAGEYADMFK